MHPSVQTKPSSSGCTLQKGIPVWLLRLSSKSKWASSTTRLLDNWFGQWWHANPTLPIKLTQHSCTSWGSLLWCEGSFWYLAAMMDEGIYFWLTEPCMDLPDNPLPKIWSSPHDIKMDNWPLDDHLIFSGSMDLVACSPDAPLEVSWCACLVDLWRTWLSSIQAWLDLWLKQSSWLLTTGAYESLSLKCFVGSRCATRRCYSFVQGQWQCYSDGKRWEAHTPI